VSSLRLYNSKFSATFTFRKSVCVITSTILAQFADNGPGLSEEDQKRIFERFFRADPSRQRTSQEGSGLGLSIVDSVMQAHGGKVGVVSKPGAGTTFTLFFPREKN